MVFIPRMPEIIMSLKSSDIAVLYALVQLTAGKKRQIKIQTIADKTYLDYRTVQSALSRLETAKRIKRYGPGARVAYHYEVLDADL